jgi:hypothetical protein
MVIETDIKKPTLAKTSFILGCVFVVSFATILLLCLLAIELLGQYKLSDSVEVLLLVPMTLLTTYVSVYFGKMLHKLFKLTPHYKIF